MPKTPENLKEVSKVDLYPKTYRPKVDKVLQWYNTQKSHVLSVNMSDEDKLQLKDIETQTRLKLQDICPIFAKQCYPDE